MHSRSEVDLTFVNSAAYLDCEFMLHPAYDNAEILRGINLRGGKMYRNPQNYIEELYMFLGGKHIVR